MTDAVDLSRRDALAATLLDQGFCLIPDALPVERIARLDQDLAEAFATTPFGQGSFYGARTKRFGRLLARSPIAAELVLHPLILSVAEHVLGPFCDCIQLNVAQAISVHPGAPAQMPHRDADMWRAPPGDVEYLINVMWPLERFTQDNGGTRLWPRSHGAAALAPEPSERALVPTLEPGSALLFLGSTLHAAGANHSDGERRGVVIGYSLGWLKPYENPWLAYPPAVARTFDPALAALAGYRQHRPNLGNYEGRCPSVLFVGDPGPLGAVDALRPEQVERVEAHRRDQVADR